MRILRGLAALLTLLAGLIGAPYALLSWGGNPWPAELSWSALRRALFQPDDGSVLIGILTVIGWIAWVVFAASVLAELLAVVSRQRIRIRLPGLGAVQRIAAGLIVAIVAMVVVAPAPSLAQPNPAPPAPVVSSQPVAIASPKESPKESRAPPAQSEVRGERAKEPADQVSHLVKVGDDLWSLAERYYGAGRDWRKIAAANPDLLTGGPDRLQPGWELTIPGVAAPESAESVLVEPGDTLTSIAEEVLGDAADWPVIFDANRAQLDNPDLIEVGQRLMLPNRDVVGDQAPDEPRPTVEPQPAETPAAEPDNPHKSAEPDKPAHNKTSPQSGGADGGANPAPPAEPPRQSVPAPVQTPVSSQPSEADLLAVAQPAALAAVGGLLAAGLVTGLAARRRLQLHLRPVGRRILHAEPAAQLLEVAIGQRQQPLSLRTLDLALRAISAHCHQTANELPRLAGAKVGRDQLELIMDGDGTPPVGFEVRGQSWLITPSDAHYLKTVPGLDQAPRPYPALVTLGRDDQDREIVIDLEAAGALTLAGQDRALVAGTLAAMAMQLSFSRWANELTIHLYGACPGLPDAVDRHHVVDVDDLDALLDRLERRAAQQQIHLGQRSTAQHRIDPDLAEPWAPEIVLINAELSLTQLDRLQALTLAEPRSAIAAVMAGAELFGSWQLQLDSRSDSGLVPAAARLAPQGWSLHPQVIEADAVTELVELVAVTGSEQTSPAPWWDHEQSDPPVLPDSNVTYIGRRIAGVSDGRRFKEPAHVEERMTSEPEAAWGAGLPHHPMLRLLGPVDLVGALGSPPPRAEKQCLEYCAWLLTHPGATAQAMATGLAVAEGTRRSNMSRLRSWLGTTDQGESYLPDAYSGRISLHPAVSSDFQRMSILIGAGINSTGTDTLQVALELVRGAPLADAAPGQWHWAEELRTDMSSVIRDLGAELCNRALTTNNIDLARWAAARSLAAAPGDELLLRARIRTEHQAGNGAEVERLALQLAAHARNLGIDLDAETVTLLQQVVEGQTRSRVIQ